MSMSGGGKVPVGGLMRRQDSYARFFDSMGMQNSAWQSELFSHHPESDAADHEGCGRSVYTFLVLKEQDANAYEELLLLGERYTKAWDQPVLKKETVIPSLICETC